MNNNINYTGSLFVPQSFKDSASMSISSANSTLSCATLSCVPIAYIEYLPKWSLPSFYLVNFSSNPSSSQPTVPLYPIQYTLLGHIPFLVRSSLFFPLYPALFDSLFQPSSRLSDVEKLILFFIYLLTFRCDLESLSSSN